MSDLVVVLICDEKNIETMLQEKLNNVNIIRTDIQEAKLIDGGNTVFFNFNKVEPFEDYELYIKSYVVEFSNEMARVVDDIIETLRFSQYI